MEIDFCRNRWNAQTRKFHCGDWNTSPSYWLFLAHPFMSPMYFPLKTCKKCNASACRDSCGLRSTIGVFGRHLFCSRSPSSLTVHGSFIAKSMDATTIAILAFDRPFRRHFCDQPLGSRRPIAYHAGSRDVNCCLFGRAFDEWALEGAKMPLV